jgi:hypothetical protein
VMVRVYGAGGAGAQLPEIEAVIDMIADRPRPIPSRQSTRAASRWPKRRGTGDDGLSGVHRPGDLSHPRQGPGHGPVLRALCQRSPMPSSRWL